MRAKKQTASLNQGLALDWPSEHDELGDKTHFLTTR